MTSAGGKPDNPSPLGHEAGIEDEHRARLAALAGELAAARSELAKADENSAALARAIEDARKRVAALESELQVATLRCQTQETLLRQRTTATARLHREVLIVQQDRISAHQRCEEELRAADLARSHLEREIQGILGSTSWRLTAPVRSAIGKLSGWIALARHRTRSVDR
jgi:hypothetical protein